MISNESWLDYGPPGGDHQADRASTAQRLALTVTGRGAFDNAPVRPLPSRIVRAQLGFLRAKRGKEPWQEGLQIALRD